MAALFGFHMPNYTFPGVPNDRLFERVIHLAKAAEGAARENLPPAAALFD